MKITEKIFPFPSFGNSYSGNEKTREIKAKSGRM